MFDKYDVIVVGAGHSGSEAAAAAANLGSKVLLITMDLTKIAAMSCNPAMGGIAKGQIVKEIDALGGYSGIVTDKTMIQFRMLNKSKGPAMWSPRAQSDRMLFSMEWRQQLEKILNLDLWQDTVVGIEVDEKRVTGVKTAMGFTIETKSVVLTNGTFLNGTIHIGKKQFGGGRMGDKASKGITEQLVSLGFESQRMKTGTPVRVDGRTINFDKLEVQPGDDKPGRFSYISNVNLDKQRDCYLAYTNSAVHDVLRLGFEDSPMFAGRIDGIGPRYCPSIEDKIDRFSDKNSHQLFVEPEGWNTIEYYINGFSSSLPEDIQFKALRKIPGFENAKIFRPGYAIEYDFFPPIQCKVTLETKLIENLYFAGQINGTTGYEEAAAQGIIAGINAHQKSRELDSFIITRSEGYIGVLIDDLVTKGVDEPYRMFTSRAEYRLLLRQNNADIRLTQKSFEIGLASQERLDRVKTKVEAINKIKKFLTEYSVEPAEVENLLLQKNTSNLKQKNKLLTLLLRPQINIAELVETIPAFERIIKEIDPVVRNESLEEAEIQCKYDAYIQKENDIAIRINKLENLKLGDKLNYSKIKALSYEAREKLNKIQPETIGQAARISGVSPADISVLTVLLSR